MIKMPSIRSSMLLAWMDHNERNHAAKKLTYSEFSSEYVWEKRLRIWVIRSRGFSIGSYVCKPKGSPKSGEGGDRGSIKVIEPLDGGVWSVTNSNRDEHR